MMNTYVIYIDHIGGKYEVKIKHKDTREETRRSAPDRDGAFAIAQRFAASKHTTVKVVDMENQNSLTIDKHGNIEDDTEQEQTMTTDTTKTAPPKEKPIVNASCDKTKNMIASIAALIKNEDRTYEDLMKDAGTFVESK